MTHGMYLKMMDLSQPFSYMRPRNWNKLSFLAISPSDTDHSLNVDFISLLRWICSHHWPYVGKLVLSNINGAFVLNICCLLLLIEVFFVSHDSTQSLLGFSLFFFFLIWRIIALQCVGLWHTAWISHNSIYVCVYINTHTHTHTHIYTCKEI